MRKSFAKERYMHVMQWVSRQPQFTNKDLMQEFDVSKSLLYNMHQIGYVTKIAKATYKWSLDRQPMLADVNALRKAANYHNHFSKTKTRQLTIKPIKPIQRQQPVPQSIIELNEKISEYPILDVAIAFLGGMVVAAFFTLIWK